MVDVDYHTDMHYWLSFGAPVILYTFCPETLSGTEFETHWHFKSFNEVEYFVSGNETYTHRIWNWNVPHLAIHARHKLLVYDVDHVPLPNFNKSTNARRIVVITPRTKTPYYLAHGLPGHRLSRLEPSRPDGTMRIDFVNAKGAKLSSIGLEHGGSLIIATNVLDIIQHKALQAKTPIEAGQVQRWLASAFGKTDTLEIDCLLLALYVNKTTNFKAPTVFARKYNPSKSHTFVPHYQSLEPDPLEEGKPLARALSKHFCDIPAVPARSMNNDYASITYRVDKVKNFVQPHSRYSTYRNEFIKFVVPDSLVGRGVPYTLQQVLDSQDKPAQRSRNQQFLTWPTHDEMKVSAFMKSEAYTALNAPRNISQLPTSHLLNLSRYTMPFSKEVLKKCHHRWYIPGHTPNEIVDKVRDFVRPHDSVLAVDYSKLDGTISEFLQTIPMGIYARYFHGYQELIRLLNAEQNPRANTKFGVA